MFGTITQILYICVIGQHLKNDNSAHLSDSGACERSCVVENELSVALCFPIFGNMGIPSIAILY